MNLSRLELEEKFVSQSITITLPDNVYRRVQNLAEETQRDVVELVTERIVDSFAGYTFPIDPNRPKMIRERAAYEAMHQSLLPGYVGKYVAIYQAELIDADDDIMELDKRVRAQYPDELILITRVEPEAQRTLHFRSPRIIR